MGPLVMSMLGWLLLGGAAWAFARETTFRGVTLDRAELLHLGAVGAWVGGSVAFFCRMSL